MADLEEAFGADRHMALCRELTKDFEEIRRDTIGAIRQSVIDDPPRGEIVLVVSGASEDEAIEAAGSAVLGVEELAQLAIETAQAQNVRIKEAITTVVREHPLPDGSYVSRKDVYSLVLEMKN